MALEKARQVNWSGLGAGIETWKATAPSARHYHYKGQRKDPRWPAYLTADPIPVKQPNSSEKEPPLRQSLINRGIGDLQESRKMDEKSVPHLLKKKALKILGIVDIIGARLDDPKTWEYYASGLKTIAEGMTPREHFISEKVLPEALWETGKGLVKGVVRSFTDVRNQLKIFERRPNSVQGLKLTGAVFMAGVNFIGDGAGMAVDAAGRVALEDSAVDAAGEAALKGAGGVALKSDVRREAQAASDDISRLAKANTQRALGVDAARVAENKNGIPSAVNGGNIFSPNLDYLKTSLGQKVPQILYSGQGPQVVENILKDDAFIAKAYKEGSTMKGSVGDALANHVSGGDTRYFLSTTDDYRTAFNDFGQKGYVLVVKPGETKFFRTKALSRETLGAPTAEHEAEYVAHGAISGKEIPYVKSLVSKKNYNLAKPEDRRALQEELDWVNKTMSKRGMRQFDLSRLRQLWPYR